MFYARSSGLGDEHSCLVPCTSCSSKGIQTVRWQNHTPHNLTFWHTDCSMPGRSLTLLVRMCCAMKLSRAAAATGWLACAAAACCCLSAICQAKGQAVTVAANWGDLEYWHKITATNSFELLCTDHGSYRDSGRLFFLEGRLC